MARHNQSRVPIFRLTESRLSDQADAVVTVVGARTGRLIGRKATSLLLIVLAQVLAMALWFSGTAAGPAMAREAALPSGFIAWLIGAVQCGVVLGTLISAAFALPDRLDPRPLIAVAALVGAAANLAILALPVRSPWAIVARGATGMALACVYPVGMKLATS